LQSLSAWHSFQKLRIYLVVLNDDFSQTSCCSVLVKDWSGSDPQTSSNPFFAQQFTGVPQQTGFTQQANPFGIQQPQQQQHGGNLIDLS
jgi:hypothetical protein